jgi:hypothetical protein
MTSQTTRQQAWDEFQETLHALRQEQLCVIEEFEQRIAGKEIADLTKEAEEHTH